MENATQRNAARWQPSHQDEETIKRLAPINLRDLFSFFAPFSRFVDWTRSASTKKTLWKCQTVIRGPTPDGGTPRQEYYLTINDAYEFLLDGTTRKTSVITRFFATSRTDEEQARARDEFYSRFPKIPAFTWGLLLSRVRIRQLSDVERIDNSKSHPQQ